MFYVEPMAIAKAATRLLLFSSLMVLTILNRTTPLGCPMMVPIILLG